MYGFEVMADRLLVINQASAVYAQADPNNNPKQDSMVCSMNWMVSKLTVQTPWANQVAATFHSVA